MQFLIPLIAFSGFLLGILLAKVAREEVKPGKVYFCWLKRIVLFLLIVVILYNAKNYLWAVLGVVLGFVLAISSEEYLFLGLALMTGFLISKEVVLLIASLVFIFGLPYGTLLKESELKSVLVIFVIFLLPFVLLPFKITLAFQNFLYGIISGGLFNFLIQKCQA